MDKEYIVTVRLCVMAKDKKEASYLTEEALEPFPGGVSVEKVVEIKYKKK